MVPIREARMPDINNASLGPWYTSILDVDDMSILDIDGGHVIDKADNIGGVWGEI